MESVSKERPQVISPIGPLQLTITWYKNRHVGEQTAHWDLQNKRILSKVALFWLSQWAVCSPAWRFLYHVHDRKLQRAHCVLVLNDRCMLIWSEFRPVPDKNVPVQAGGTTD